MDVKIEEVTTTERRLAVEVPFGEVAAELDRAFGRLQREAKVKGFRPGHVPRAVLERYFGDQVRADVLSHMIEHSFTKAIEDSQLRPVAPPSIVPEKIESGQPLRYSATIEIQPEVTIGMYQGLSARRPVRAVTDRDVDRALENVRQSLAELRPIEERTDARQGDFVSVDYTASIDGRDLPEGRRENRLVEVGAGAVPGPIDEALVGMTVGEKKEIDVEFPADHPDPKLAEKAVRFEVTLRGLREKIVPPIDDDLAREHGESATLEELRDKLRARIDESMRRQADDQVREQLVDELLAKNPFDVPKSFCERQAESVLGDALARSGVAVEDLRREPERLEQLLTEVRPRATRQVRAALALDAIARTENLEVTEDEIDARVNEMAAGSSEQNDKVRAAYRELRAREALRERLLREKTLERVVAAAHVEDVAAPADDVAPTEQNR